jgi:hypothetical protein
MSVFFVSVSEYKTLNKSVEIYNTRSSCHSTCPNPTSERRRIRPKGSYIQKIHNLVPILSFVRQAGSVPFRQQFLFSTGGTGLASNHDKEAHRDSDSVFYSLI